MWHMQRTIPNWLESVQRLPDGALVKSVDNGQIFREVKGINPNINTCLRHWYDPGQVFGGSYAENKQRARTFFETFIDGTFINEIAPHCDYIEEFNEYLAVSQNQEEIADRLRWAQAAADVWLYEYRNQPELAHIRLVLCNTAIGNDIAEGFFHIAQDYNAVLGYHPYTYWKDGQRGDGDWRWLSGRWNFMELEFGESVDWLFTEAGPFESAIDGWKSSNCLNNDVNAYVEAVRQWIRDVAQTGAYAEGRIKGFALFTTGGSSQWKQFETGLVEMNLLANMISQEWRPPTAPPPPPPPPPDNDDVPYVVVVNLIPQDVTDAEYDYTRDQTKANKETILQSADDAARLVAPGQPGSKVKVWAGYRWPGIIDLWLIDRGVNIIEHLEYPSASGIDIVDIVNNLPVHETLQYSTRALTDITTLTIHHTVSPTDRSIASIAAYHVNDPDRQYPGIAYHYVITVDGGIFQTNYLETTSYHAGTLNAPGDENLWSVGIALQGNFSNDPPPQAQLDATRQLVSELKRDLDINDVLGHRQMPGAQTQCPGNTWEQWFDYVGEG